MSLLDFIFGKKNTSAKIARDRLQIIIAQERYQSQIPDYLPTLRRELMEVLSKYVNISPDDIRITQEKNEDMEVLELNITLSEIKGDAIKEDSPDGGDEDGEGDEGIGGSQKKK